MNATLDITETTTEIASRATSFPSATSTRDTTPPSEPASALKEPSSSEESARRSLTVLPTHTTTPSVASAIPDTSSMSNNDASQSTSSSPTALPTHTSTESHAPATSESSNKTSMPVPLVPQELNGMDKSVTIFLLKPAPLATSSTKTSTNASPLLLHVETTPTSTEPPASA